MLAPIARTAYFRRFALHMHSDPANRAPAGCVSRVEAAIALGKALNRPEEVGLTITMASIPTKVRARLQTGLRRFQPVLASAKARDVNESDTVTIVTDMLNDLLGYDKYSEVTSEYAIRGTYVDLAIKIDGKLHLLIEVKAIGQTLDDRHMKQAVDYAANEGIEWVVLTNGVTWRTYKVLFGKPIHQELFMDVDLLAINARSASEVDHLFPLTKEGVVKSALQEHHEQRQATNRFVLGAILQTEPVLEMVRREVRRVSPNVKVDLEALRRLLTNEVLKREVVEGEKAIEARQKVKRSATKRLRLASPPEVEVAAPTID